MIDVKRFIHHVNSPKSEGHSFTVGINGPVVDIRPTWHYHERVHSLGVAGHTHTPDEFGTPDD